ncbi:MAG: tRNA uridine-5-carboxymethylaminomethyl(34) synthesis GTPase MnmE [Bacteroidetes bacterium]|nr:MAG: tRNA uridine-5-carboxymethylaminomethyl(34) synthesis GTPase MnmE [Bacteroidota bacterium]REK00079.1 MAG: tRNA uridine-5-carboxymethylaminomethyl(34) synthesis GTPase MnmE [Bacteroidota bacterium]REK35917.1 MAG: tRNA uridine-5-carboxymethylaminomethyl(34) synthesis GTPase MnmE [Bacteroidota bacterium]REK49362.1 MAG: tRNA uridine-5-carboxymethylaminomethyl(34) synthesis GTPase MnmE [Bacteroidota bacterium]
MHRKDTIVAMATAPGTGAIAVIRLSGSNAFGIAGKLFKDHKGRAKDFSDANTHTLHFGMIEDEGKLLDEVLLAIMRGPKSYTGEDVVEISCHGSPYIQQKIMQACLMHGARLAEAGEFTLRAFLNGKMDLSQAEAVADLISADSGAAHELALKQMRGGFSDTIQKLREELIHFASLIELELDFAEEDVEFAGRKELTDTVAKLSDVIEALISSFDIGNVLKQGIPVVIAGEPNVGKSTLMNALLNEERAIVSEIAGTTRDTIEEEIVLSNVKFRFIDTAGIRETNDAIEKIGVEKTYEKIRQSPVILYVFDVSNETQQGLRNKLENLKSHIIPGFRIIPVGNKSEQHEMKKLQEEFSGIEHVIFISAKDKQNLHSISEALSEQVNTGLLKVGNNVVSNVRHHDALKKTQDSLKSVMKGLNSGLSNDFIAQDLRHALHHLGSITGQISSDDLLDNIFSKFCIGK